MKALRQAIRRIALVIAGAGRMKSISRGYHGEFRLQLTKYRRASMLIVADTFFLRNILRDTFAAMLLAMSATTHAESGLFQLRAREMPAKISLLDLAVTVSLLIACQSAGF